jgi:hypothetical protein
MKSGTPNCIDGVGEGYGLAFWGFGFRFWLFFWGFFLPACV